jgi:NADH:ubiquinone oxidoreductase subunit 5 (subunit L)/multisubunit Na+/H+ antiporter MnhA subunit
MAMTEWASQPHLYDLLLTAIPLVSLAGALTILLMSGSKFSSTSRGIGMSVSAIVICFASCVFVRSTSSNELAMTGNQEYEWLRVEGTPTLSISFGLQGEPMMLLFVVASAIATFMGLATREFNPSSTPGRFARQCALSLLLLFSVSMVALTTDGMAMFFFLQLAGLCAAASMSGPMIGIVNLSSSRKWLLFSMGSDLFFLMGLLSLWLTMGTILFDQLVWRELPPGITFAGFCFMMGCFGRSAQIPFLGLNDDVACVADRSAIISMVCVVLPLGIVLLIRFIYVILAVENLQLCLGVVGSCTAILAGCVSVTRCRMTETIVWASSGIFGLMVVGLGSGQVLGIAGSFSLMLQQVVLVSSLIAATWLPTRDIIVSERLAERPGEIRETLLLPAVLGLIGISLLTLGFAGQNEVFSSILAGYQRDDGWRIVAPTLLTLCLAAQLLMSFALFRALFHCWRSQEVNRKNSDARETSLPLLKRWVPVIGIIAASLLATAANIPARNVDQILPEFLSMFFLQTTLKQDWFFPSITLLVSGMGGVAAWLVTSSEKNAGKNWHSRFTWLARHAERGFYFDHIWNVVLIRPVRITASICRFCEWFFLDFLLIGITSRFPKWIASQSHPLRNAAFTTCALSVFLATAVLLALLIWPGG